MSEGRVLKAYNSFYYVAAGGVTYTCKVKGRMKQERFSLCPGDLVTFDQDGTAGMITSVLPRRNFMTRPTVANLDALVLTMAVAKPLFSPLILDKLLVLAATHKMPVLLALNKMDAAVPEETQALVQIYRQAGYRVFPVSAKTGAGIPELQAALAGKITAFGGPCGVGKSSLMNALDPELAQQTGALSEKISRGKHTTRFTTLVPFNGGYLADTPGFGNVFLEGVELGDLAGYFPEFAAYAQECKFTPCTHDHEKICGVKNAVAAGRIARSRYASYLALRQELTAAGERMYRK